MYLPRAASLFRGIKNPDIECPATRHVNRPRATRTQQPELLLGHGRTMAAADSQLLHSGAVKRLVVVVTCSTVSLTVNYCTFLCRRSMTLEGMAIEEIRTGFAGT